MAMICNDNVTKNSWQLSVCCCFCRSGRVGLVADTDFHETMVNDVQSSPSQPTIANQWSQQSMWAKKGKAGDEESNVPLCCLVIDLSSVPVVQLVCLFVKLFLSFFVSKKNLSPLCRIGKKKCDFSMCVMLFEAQVRAKGQGHDVWGDQKQKMQKISTGTSHVVTHRTTNPARPSLTSMIWREWVFYWRYDRSWHQW
jgi:hypothetical protein